MCAHNGAGKGCKDGYGGPMLNASLGSEFEASSASPDMRTQPRLGPPAEGVWIAKEDFWGSGVEKKDFDLGV